MKVSAKGELSQERYTSVHPVNGTDDTAWYVPYNFITTKNTTVNTRAFGWLLPTENSTNLNVDLAEKDWIVLNVDQTGYYRVLYEEKNYKNLAEELIHGNIYSIPSNSRSQIIDDLFDFVKTGRVKPQVYLNLIQYLRNETSFVAWYTATDAINHLNKVLSGTKNYNTFRNFVSDLAAPFYETFGVETNGKESHYDKYLHLYATNLACEYEVMTCLNQTRAHLEKLLTENKVEKIDYRAVIYINGARTLNEEQLGKLWQRFLSLNKQDERNEILNALGKTHDATYLNNALQRAFDEYAGVQFTEGERALLINSVLTNKNSGLSLVIDALANRTEDELKRVGSLYQIVLNIADRIVTHDNHERVR